MICVAVSRLFSVYSNYFYTNIQEFSGVAILLASMVWLRLIVLIIFYGAILYQLCSQGLYHPIEIIKSFLRF